MSLRTEWNYRCRCLRAHCSDARQEPQAPLPRRREAFEVSCSTDEEIYEVLANLRKGLDAKYQRCLDRIAQNGKRWQYTEKALHWLSVAVEPLKMNELQEALVINDLTGEQESRRAVLCIDETSLTALGASQSWRSVKANKL